MDDLKSKLKTLIAGDVLDDEETLEKFSHDASMFELKPEVVVAPKGAEDVKKLVNYVNENKNLSLTVRSGGTCMSGGAINDSIILDFSKYFTSIKKVTDKNAVTEPGVFYRDFEVETLKKGVIMPSYPASRDLCTVGGMVANNAGGEKSLQYGKTEKYINQLKVVFFFAIRQDRKIH